MPAGRRRRHLTLLNTLSNRLVDIYRGGMPDATTLLLESDGMDDLQTRAEYLRRIEEADSSLVSSVRSLRDQVANRLAAVEDAQQRAHEFNAADRRGARPDLRRPRPGRGPGPAAAALRAQRQAAIDSLQSQVSGWTSTGPAAWSASPPGRPRARSTSGSATGRSRSRSCSASPGATSAPSTRRSGAGGAYQILPSTWELYGGHGDPQDALTREQQSDIAAQIWADSGSAAWECAQ